MRFRRSGRDSGDICSRKPTANVQGIGVRSGKGQKSTDMKAPTSAKPTFKYAARAGALKSLT